MPKRSRRSGRYLPPDRTIRPDAVLLYRELRWTIGAILILGSAGYGVAEEYGALTGAGSGFLLQQGLYKLAVRTLWDGWLTRSITYTGIEQAREDSRISLRAFTLWMRTATMRERLYIALWKHKTNDEENPDEVAGSCAEMRIGHAYTRALRLDNEPLHCDNLERRRLRRSLERDETRLLQLATGQRLED